MNIGHQITPVCGSFSPGGGIVGDGIGVGFPGSSGIPGGGVGVSSGIVGFCLFGYSKLYGHLVGWKPYNSSNCVSSTTSQTADTDRPFQQYVHSLSALNLTVSQTVPFFNS